MQGSLRIAVDSGGTFTDIVELAEESGEFRMAKTPTIPSNNVIGVLNAVDKLNVDLIRVQSFFIHGSTIAINTLIEKKGVRTAYIGTEGFRDVPEIGRYNRTEIFNCKYKNPPLLIRRNLRFEVRERMLFTGEVLLPLDLGSAREVARRLKSSGVEAVAVCLHHAYKNPAHEQELRDIILEECPNITISLSSEVAREHREYERGMTTIVDAYIKPAVATWIDELDAILRKRGLDAELLLTRSDGGAMRGQMGKESPVNTLLSGPAGGVVGAMFLADKIGVSNIITMDMGGTSCDVSIIKDGEARTTAETNLEGYPVLIPNLDIRSVGAGGGSISWVDEAGGLHVGPQSAGATPGPICYDQGGIEPTVTDALLSAGYIDPEYFLGGEMPLNVNLARRGIVSKVGNLLGMDLEVAAGGILSIAFDRMVHAVRGMTIEEGDDPRDFSLFCYGGGASLFGALISGELGMQSTIIPNVPANFSAWGMLTADVRHSFVETNVVSLNESYTSRIRESFDRLVKKGFDVLAAERIPEESREIRRSLDMRYTGQEHSVNVPVGFSIDGDFRTELKKAFNRTYNSVYGYTLPHPIQIANFRVAAIGRIANPRLRQIKVGSGGINAALKGTRNVFDFVTHTATEYKIYERAKLQAGNVIHGPALIEEPTTVSHIPKDSRCVVDKFGNLIITVKEQGKGNDTRQNC